MHAVPLLQFVTADVVRRVLLFDRIESERCVQQHVNAIYFVRPTSDNIKLLCKQLNPADSPPVFGQYNLFFSNHLSDDKHIQDLAQADQHELVKLVEEYFADFLALSASCADLLVPSLPCLALGAELVVEKVLVDKLVSLCMALKRRPSVRFRSPVGRVVAREFYRGFEQVARDCSADFKRSDSAPLLLLIDRRDDMITPIVKDWT